MQRSIFADLLKLPPQACAVCPYINRVQFLVRFLTLVSHLSITPLRFRAEPIQAIFFSMSHPEGSGTTHTPHAESSAMPVDLEDQQSDNSHHEPPPVPAAQSNFLEARQRRKIAELEGKLEVLESGRGRKERSDHHLHVELAFFFYGTLRQTNFFLAQGRVLRRVVTLYDSIEDLVIENDRRYDEDDEDATLE